MEQTRVESMLTTIDNPHDPFDDYDEWFAWDFRHGYHTPSYLARVVVMSHETSEPDQSLAIEQGIDEIVDENVNGMYKKVTRPINVELVHSEVETEIETEV